MASVEVITNLPASYASNGARIINLVLKKKRAPGASATLNANLVMNAPQPDAYLIAEAGVTLDRALLPLLARLGRRGPMGVVELADAVGRDHTTVSRQVAKLESLRLIERRPGAQDKRVREAVLTAKGVAINTALDAARDRIFRSRLDAWPEAEMAELGRLLRKFADEALAWMKNTGDQPYQILPLGESYGFFIFYSPFSSHSFYRCFQGSKRPSLLEAAVYLCPLLQKKKGADGSTPFPSKL